MLRVKRQRPLFILVGNKCDKTYEWEVTKDEGIALARSFGCSFMETSAKTAHNIKLVFTNLVRALRTMQQMAGGMPNPRNPLEEKKQRKCVIL
jgi:GTPase KRas protein